MAFFSPVSHMHYLLFSLPMTMSLLVRAWQDQTAVLVPWPLAVCFIVFNLAMALAYLPGLEVLKDRCVPLFATLPMWISAVVQMWRFPTSASTTASEARMAAVRTRGPPYIIAIPCKSASHARSGLVQ